MTRKIKKGILFVLATILTHWACAQDCKCSDSYVWLKETIEKNDAGFQYVIDKKGEQEYQKHCDTYADKVQIITDQGDCAETLFNWLRFFRNGHLSIRLSVDNRSKGKNDSDTAKIKEQFENWETYAYNEKEFDSYVSTIKAAKLEGIWAFSHYTIGIRKVNNEYIGFIIEADGVYWHRTQIKLKIREENGSLIATFYMRDHSARTFTDVELLGNNYLQMGFTTLKRIKPAFPPNRSIDMYFKFLTTPVPLFEKLSDKTALLRIPSFSHMEKKRIDSIIEVNWQLITNTENLIIDVRNNGGGSHISFEKILSIIYTDPIRKVGVELLSTPLNNQRMVHYMNDPDWPADEKKGLKDNLDKLNQHIGEFVNLDSTTVTVRTLDTIYPYPKNVGIIINEGCMSTTEQFLLAAKQSKKVKLFGTATAGVLDIGNMNFIESPCKDLKLGYALSKSMRIPYMTIDDKGIQPDYYIDKTVSKYDWIDFVQKTLSNGE